MRRWSDGRAKSFASSGGGGGGVLPAPAPPRSSLRHDLLAVVYAEFDNISGPVIRCQAPEGFLSQEVFDSISEYVITGRQLCGRTINVTACDYQILSFPICIDHEKYSRNTLFFNVSLVVRAGASTAPWEPIVRKIALTMCAMELESEFLFKPSNKAALSALLPRILHDLSRRGECLLHLDDANLLTLKLVTPMRPPPEVGAHEVPVLLRDAALLSGLDWDLSLRQVVPYIDGVKYAKHIAMEAEMDEDCVRRALRVLVHYNLIALVDIFQFSNIYVTTEHFQAFAASPTLQAQCQSFVCTVKASALPTRDIIRLYAAFRPDVTLADVVMRHRHHLDKVDARRLVTFGVVHKLLRRVHRYPVFVRAPAAPRSITLTQSMTAFSPTMAAAMGGAGGAGASLVHRVQEAMDGAHTADALCVQFMRPVEELEELVGGDEGHVYSVYR